jgi:hypothetical protein
LFPVVFENEASTPLVGIKHLEFGYFLLATVSSVSRVGLNKNTIITVSVGPVLLVVIVAVVVVSLVRKRSFRRSGPGVENNRGFEESLVTKDLSRYTDFYI